MSAAQIVSITNHRVDKELVLSLDDGSHHALAWLTLRTACRCASCASARLSGREVTTEQGVELTHIAVLGNGDLNLHFSDGHQRGIYPLSYLVELASVAIKA